MESGSYSPEIVSLGGPGRVESRDGSALCLDSPLASLIPPASSASRHGLLGLPPTQPCPVAKHESSLNPNYVICNPTVGQGGGAWTTPRSRAKDLSWSAPQAPFHLCPQSSCQPPSFSIMSGRVGDLSPKQAEALAKVRALFPGGCVEA